MPIDDATIGKWLVRLLGSEGGFQNDPKDSGNWTGGAIGAGVLVGTKWGISAASYPTLNIPVLTQSDAAEIYKRDFIAKLNAPDSIPDGILFQIFDAAVNSGQGNAIKMLQRAAQVPDDGIPGTKTWAAVASFSESDIIMLFIAERLEFMTSLRSWDTYGKGWVNRMAHNLRYGADDS